MVEVRVYECPEPDCEFVGLTLESVKGHKTVHNMKIASEVANAE